MDAVGELIEASSLFADIVYSDLGIRDTTTVS
jgi:hypothetical protein